MKWFANLKIRSKLIFSITMLCFVTVIIGIKGLLNAGDIGNMLDSLYQNEELGIIHIKEANNDMLAYSRSLNSYLLANSPQQREEHIKNMTKYKKLLLANIEAAIPLVKSETGKNLIARLNNDWDGYTKEVDRVIELGAFDNFTDKQNAIDLFENEVRTKSDAINSLFEKLTRIKENDSKEYFTQSISEYKESRLYTILLLIGVVGAGLGFGLYVSNLISKPLKSLLSAAHRMGEGDLNVKIDIANDDEIGDLTKAFQHTIEKVSLQIQYLENIPNPVMVIDKDFNIKYMNKSGARTVNNSQQKLIGMKCYDQFKTEHCRTENCALFRAMRDDAPVTTETIARPGNEEMPIMYTGAPIKNMNGEIIGAVEEVTNIKTIKDAQNYLTRSTKKMLTAMDRFSEGDLTVKIIPEVDDDDIGKLYSGFNKSVDNIKRIIHSVTNAVEATASAVNQISSSSEEMAAGAQEQSSQTQEVASAIEQMTRTILETTKNAGNTAEEAKNAGSTADEGGKVVSETIKGMSRIADVVTRAAETVRELGKSSDQIGQIIQVIEDIADQTNLLALNAAIEAARAGDQGRGFAVVADEVRKLAERTSKATKEIAEMIKKIQKNTGGAVESIERGAEEVNIGTELASKAKESLEKIIAGSTKVVDRAMQVSAASEEQSAAAEQISKNIEAISNVTQESAAGVQQIAKASEDLNRLTENLQNLINKFKYNDAEDDGYYRGLNSGGSAYETRHVM